LSGTNTLAESQITLHLTRPKHLHQPITSNHRIMKVKALSCCPPMLTQQTGKSIECNLVNLGNSSDNRIYRHKSNLAKSSSVNSVIITIPQNAGIQNTESVYLVMPQSWNVHCFGVSRIRLSKVP